MCQQGLLFTVKSAYRDDETLLQCDCECVAVNSGCLLYTNEAAFLEFEHALQKVMSVHYSLNIVTFAEMERYRYIKTFVGALSGFSVALEMISVVMLQITLIFIPGWVACNSIKQKA